MTIDFVLSGSRGFMGRHLMQQLADAGYRIMTDRDFANTDEQARIFVNCANIAPSPSANLKLTRRKIELVRGRVDTFVQIQSFSTLSGKSAFAPHAFNLGFRPSQMNFYAAGKLEQERLLLTDTSFVPHLCLVYLPAVMGEGSAWTAAIEQAHAFGAILPQGMHEDARANNIDIKDLGHFLEGLRNKPLAAPLFRAVLNNPQAEHTRWQAFLTGAAGAPSVERLTAKQKMRVWLISAAMRTIALLYKTRLLVAADTLLRKLRPVGDLPAGGRSRPPAQAEPLRFTGVSRPLVRRQGYIPQWD
jgi:nucleoside-diphosphate-sugar epimerase